MKKYKDIIFAVVPGIILMSLVLMAYTDIKVDLKDPWYRAISEFEQARKNLEKEPEKSKEIIEQSGKKLKDLIKKYPYHARLHFLYGYYLANTGKPLQAMDEFEVAYDKGKGGIVNQVDIQARQYNTQIAINYSNQLIQRKKINEALDIIKRALKIDFDNPNLYSQIAYLYTNMNNVDSTIYYYKQSLRINPNFEIAKKNLSNVYFRVGNNYIKLNDWDNSYFYYKEAIELEPNIADYYNNLGNVCLKLQKYDEAVNSFEMAVKIQPNNSVYNGNLKLAKNTLSKINPI